MKRMVLAVLALSMMSFAAETAPRLENLVLSDAKGGNYSIDATELKAGRSAREVTFTMSKPSAGWPTGAYRVDLFIDGKPAGQVPFSVGK